MPECIKDSKKYYSGDEPSPKGLGLCAHSEEVGTIKDGLDGNKWIIVKTLKNIKRWTKYNNEKVNQEKIVKNNELIKSDCLKFVIYEKEYQNGFFIKSIKYDQIIGLEDKKGYIRKFITYNDFEKIYTKIPDDYKKKKLNNNIINLYYCGSKIILTKNNTYYKIIKKKYIGYKKYFTHFNGGRPYLVYIKDNNVAIYSESDNFSIDDSLYSNNYNDNKWMYINLVETYKVNKVFIGRSPLIKMTESSGGYGKYFDGNTILLLLNNNNYIYIRDNIKKFKINDKIKKYFSFVGYNDIPYPMAIGEKNIYFFGYPSGYLPVNEFLKFKSEKNLQEIFDKSIELDPFLIPFEENHMENPLISLEEFKKIKNKILNEISLDEIQKLAKMYDVTTTGNKKELVDEIEKLKGITIYKK
jgi:hypothetical protein